MARHPHPLSPPPDLSLKPVKIVVTANHIYLPLDDDGNCLAWEGERNLHTVRVERRARLLVHPDMAKSLEKQDRAEILE